MRSAADTQYDQELLLTISAGAKKRYRTHLFAAPVTLEGAIVATVAISLDVAEQQAAEEHAAPVGRARYRADEQSPLRRAILAPDRTTVQFDRRPRGDCGV